MHIFTEILLYFAIIEIILGVFNEKFLKFYNQQTNN